MLKAIYLNISMIIKTKGENMKETKTKIKYIEVEKKETKKTASKVLGILSICLFFLTWVGVVLGIIGLCLKKEEGREERDILLNVIGLILSFFWTIYVISTLGVL